jgi:hypothetical protein
LHSGLCHSIVHDLKPGPDGEAEQNFYRGQVAAFERLLEFEQELKDWKERLK